MYSLVQANKDLDLDHISLSGTLEINRLLDRSKVIFSKILKQWCPDVNLL